MRILVAVGLVLVLGACASSPDANRGEDERLVITQEQIAASGGTTLYDVVNQYHPEWLLVGRDGVLVIVDRGQSGAGIDYLRMRGTSGVFELEYLNEVQTRSRFRGHAGRLDGAIIVRTQPRGSR